MPPKTRALLETLEAELGAGAVLNGEAVSQRPQGICRPAPLEAPAIVRPKDTREVSFVLKACFAAGAKRHSPARADRPRPRRGYGA